MAGKSGRNISNVPEKSLKKNILSWEGMLVVVFVLIVIFCRSISPNFHVTNVLREMPKYLAEGFIMLAMAYVLILGEIDISVGAIVCLSSTWTCMVCNKGLPFGAVVLVCLLVGTVCGLINGLVLTKFTELPPMIVTLATQIIFRGSVYAIGSNSTAAYFAGIPVQRIRLIIYTALGFMSGLAALFLTSVLYGANTTTGNGFEMDAIAMAVFGGISTSGGKGRLVGGIIAAFVIISLRIGLGQINMNPQLILVILGALLILAVLLPNIAGELKLKKKAASAK